MVPLVCFLPFSFCYFTFLISQACTTSPTISTIRINHHSDVLLLLLLLLLPPLLTLRDERGGNSPTIWMTSLISVEEEKPSTMAPSGKSVMEESSVISVVDGLLISINVADAAPAPGCSACNTTTSASVLTAVVVVGGALVEVVEVIGTSVVGVVVVEASVTVVLLAVVVLLARPELALLPLDRILSPICWA
jgi:hypothetical protein